MTAQTLFSQTSANEYYNSGKQKMDSSDYISAIKDFDKAWKSDTTNYTILSDRGFCKWQTGDLDGAFDDYYFIAQNASIDSGRIVQYAVQEIGFVKGNEVKLQVLNELIKRYPSFTEFYDTRAYTLHSLKRYSEELSDLEYLNSQKDYNAEYLQFRIAAYYKNTDQYEEAIPYYNRIINELMEEYNINKSFIGIYDFHESLLFGYIYRAECKFALDDYRGALDDCNTVINFYLQQSKTKKTIEHLSALRQIQIYTMRGRVNLSLKHFTNTVSDMDKVLQILSSSRISPNEDFKAQAYYYRATAKHNLNDKEGACRDWSKAGEQGLSEAYDYIKKFCK